MGEVAMGKGLEFAKDRPAGRREKVDSHEDAKLCAH